MNIKFCCHLCCSDYTIVKIQSSAMYGDPFHLVLVFGHSSSKVMMSSHDVYGIITLETAAVDMPNEVAILVTNAPTKRIQTICPL